MDADRGMWSYSVRFMRRLTHAEMGALILSVLFILVGASTLLRPLERYVVHPSDTGGMAPSYGETGEHMSRNKARVYGATALIAGALIGSLALYRGKEELKSPPHHRAS
jgi:hypothetical protein